MKVRVGFMGLGIMGAAMAANIRRAGYPLMVFNRTTSRAEALAACLSIPSWRLYSPAP